MKALAGNKDSILKELRMVNQVRYRVITIENNLFELKKNKKNNNKHATQSSHFLYVFQYFAGGAGAEGEIAIYLDKIKTITKLGYNFTVPSYRTKVDGFIMRNLDFGKQT